MTIVVADTEDAILATFSEEYRAAVTPLRDNKRDYFFALIARLNTVETVPFNSLPPAAKRWYNIVAYALPDLGENEQDAELLRRLPWPDDL